MVNFENEKTFVRKMFKSMENEFESDGSGIEDTLKSWDPLFDEFWGHVEVT